MGGWAACEEVIVVLAFIGGLVLGSSLGVVIAAMCAAASRADRAAEDQVRIALARAADDLIEQAETFLREDGAR